MARSPKPRSNWRATTFWIARTWTKRSNGRRAFRRHAKAGKAASKSGLSPEFRGGLKWSPPRPAPGRGMADIRAAAEELFRNESGRILAALIGISGSFDRAEEAMQEAFAAALTSWPQTGVPEKGAAWIMTTAHRKLIDSVRREQTRRDKQDALRYETERAASLTGPDLEDTAMHFPDDRLRLIFTCCHPALNQEAQVALTLRTLGGLSTTE